MTIFDLFNLNMGLCSCAFQNSSHSRMLTASCMESEAPKLPDSLTSSKTPVSLPAASESPQGSVEDGKCPTVHSRWETEKSHTTF